MSILKKKSSSPKYELLSVDKRYKFSSNIEDKLHQIRNIKTGELGGFIESESNLSQQGKCWIDVNSKVYGNACVSDDAIIINSTIKDNAQVYGNVTIKNSTIEGDSKVFDSALVQNCSITDSSEISDKAKINYLRTSDKTRIYKNCSVNMDSEEYVNVDFNITKDINHNELLDMIERLQDEDDFRETVKKAYNEV